MFILVVNTTVENSYKKIISSFSVNVFKNKGIFFVIPKWLSCGPNISKLGKRHMHISISQGKIIK